MNGKKGPRMSRREFARRAAIASAVSLVPASAVKLSSASEVPPPQTPKLPQLTPEGQAEVEGRLQTILNLYGSRFSEAQKADLRRLCTLAQPPLIRLRAYPLENGDGPGLYLKPLMEREKKPAARSSPSKPPEAKKKS